MAFTDVPFGDDAAAQVFETQAYIDKYKTNPHGVLIEHGCVRASDELRNANAGDQTTINTFDVLEGRGRTENEGLETNEEAPNRGSFKMAYNETWHAVKIPSKTNVKQMRLTTDMAEVGVDSLFDWSTDRQVRSIFNQGGGNTATSITVEGQTYTGAAGLGLITGHNTPVAPSANRVIRANGVANDQTLSSADTHTLDMLDDIIATISAGLPRFKPAGDGLVAIGFVHPFIMRDLKHDAEGAIQWYPNALAYAQGGDFSELKEGMMGGRGFYEYAGLRIYEDYRVPLGVHSDNNTEVANVYRSIFFGKDAIFGASPFGLSLDDEDVPLILARETFDYGRYLGVAGGRMDGYKKFRGVRGEDNNVFVTTAYAAS